MPETTAAAAAGDEAMSCIVVGVSGSGKSTFARALAQAHSVPHVELDALYWLPGWVARERDDFRHRAAQATRGDAWVADGNYSATRDLLWPRATHVVWLHYGRLTVLWRIVRRTMVRLVCRQALWSGNRETFARAFLSRESPILWSMQTYDKHQRNYRALRASANYSQLTWVELRSPRQARAFLRAQCRRA